MAAFRQADKRTIYSIGRARFSFVKNRVLKTHFRGHGFAAPDAVLTAPETRSSSPVRIVRDELRQASLRGLYPCGEGAGYAGGIMSAAVDGMLSAEAMMTQ